MLRGHHKEAIDMADGACGRARETATPRAQAFTLMVSARAPARAGNRRQAYVQAGELPD